MGNLQIKWEEVKELLPETTSLVYVDYRESFDDNFDLLQECLNRKCWSGITEEIEFYESENDSIDYIEKELKTSLMSKYEISEEQADEIIEENQEAIRDYCYEKNDSTPIDDMLSNTSPMIAHYDTGYYMESESWNWADHRVRYERMKIKKFLGIKDSSHDDGIDMMIQQATYGGQLLIYFNMDFNEFMEKIETTKTICFDGAVIGIVDHYGGSGDIYDGGIHNIKLPFNSNNVFLEKSIKYNWTYSIAGMCTDWADSTIVELLETPIDGEVEDSPQVARQKQEEEYNKTFKEGGCTFGDMDIRRHRNTPYGNNFPCGNKCTECGTFWID